jgi:hypothetical protein
MKSRYSRNCWIWRKLRFTQTLHLKETIYDLTPYFRWKFTIQFQIKLYHNFLVTLSNRFSRQKLDSRSFITSSSIYVPQNSKVCVHTFLTCYRLFTQFNYSVTHSFFRFIQMFSFSLKPFASQLPLMFGSRLESLMRLRCIFLSRKI